ncbi:MAG: phage tail tape measure protein [Clostridiales bacterium]|nr:phage tail tape measure protein [Clostridiales bacterium]
MARRKIGATIALDGEKQFRQAVTECSRALTNMRSEMRLVQTETAGQANSLESLQKKHTVLTRALEEHEKKEAAVAAGLAHAQQDYSRVGTELENYKKKLQDAKAKLEEMEKSGDATDEELKEQRQVVADLSKVVEQGEQAYQKAGNRVQDWETKLNNAKAETIDASRAVDENARYMDEAASSADGCAKSIDEYGKKTEDAADSSEKLGQSSKEAISDLESVLASAGILAALDRLKDGFMECAAAAESFEYAVAQVGTIAGAGNMDQMADQILALSNASGQASEELAQTAYSALSAGSAVESAVGDAQIATELATAGFTDTTSALQVLKTAMNSYGDAQSDLQHVSDSLIMTQNLGVTTIAELSQNMGVAIASASAYNVSLENLEAAYIATTKSGINTANSTTYLSRMFSELGDSGSTVSKIITNQTGKSFGQLMKEGYSLADVLEILYESCGNDAEAMMQLWQQQSSGKAANAIINQGLSQFRQNLDRVTNSAGATSKAYGIMESTTQHAHERMANSMKNLASVVGGELNPVLEDVYNAIADMSDGIQGFIKEHPAVVGGVTAIALGLGTLVAAVAAYSIGVKAASVVTTLWTASMAVNPIFAIITAVTAATVAIGAFVAIIRKGVEESAQAITPVTQEMKEMTKATQEANDKVKSSLDGMNKGFNDSKAAAEGSATQAKKLADRLKELAGKSELTAAEQAEMSDIIGKLNGAYPSLNLKIDEHTGKLNKSAEAIDDYIEKMKQMQIAQAYYDAASDAYKAVAEAQIAVTDAETNLNALQEEGNKLKQDQLELLGKNADEMVEYNGQQMSVFEALNLIGTALGDNNKAQEEANAAIEEANGLTEEATAKADAYMNKYGELTAATEAQTAAQEAGNATQQASIEVSEQALSAWGNLSAGQQQTAADFANAVTSLVDSTQQALDSQMNMFEEFNGGAEVSTETLLSNMQSQIDGVANWERNMAELADRGINQDLLQHLAEMGPEGSGYVEAFVNMSDEEFAQANDLWSQSVDMKSMTDQWGQDLMDSGAENIANSMDGISEIMETSGAETALGLARGIESAAAQAGDAADAMGVDVIERANAALGVQSPSWKMEESGMNMDQGLANGMINGIGVVDAACSQLANSVVTGVTAKVQNAGGGLSAAGRQMGVSLGSGLRSSIGAVQGAANEVGRITVTMINVTNSYQGPANNAGLQLSTRLATGIRSGIGLVQTNSRSVGEMTKELVNAAVAQQTPAYNAGKGVADKLASGLKDGQSGVKTAASNTGGAASALVDAANDVKGDAHSAGVNISKGLANGISDAVGYITSAARAAVRAGINAAKDEAGIASPSKVARFEIGQMWGRGLALGILDSSREIEAAVKDTMSPMTETFNSDGGLVNALNQLSGGNLYNAVKEGMESANLGIYLDGREVGRTVRDMRGGSVAWA